MSTVTETAKAATIAYNDKNWDKMKTVFAESGVYDEKGTGRRIQGIGQIIEAFQAGPRPFRTRRRRSSPSTRAATPSFSRSCGRASMRARSRRGRALSRRRTSTSRCPRARFSRSRVARSRASPTTSTW
jgi:hypothetical protein